MKTSDAGIKLIKGFEGYRSWAYQDSGGVWTIGYGHTPAHPNQKCTVPEAEQMLANDLKGFEFLLNSYLAFDNLTVSQPQFDALISILFNVGPGKARVKDGIFMLSNGRPSTLWRKMQAGDMVGAADEFPRWVYAGGMKLEGLARRRQAERTMFLSGLTPDSPPVSPNTEGA